MTEPSQVLRTSYTMTNGMDYTEATVRVRGKDVSIRVGGFKASKDAYPFLIEEAELQAGLRRGMNGSVDRN